MNIFYFFYFFGAFLMLAIKYFTYIKYGRIKGESVKTSTIDWFFSPTKENAVSWITTIAIVWLGGVIYIEKLPVPYLTDIFALPLHNAMAFFLGILVEYVAPTIMKGFVGFVQKIMNRMLG